VSNLIAIVGRSNVGKSALFNRIVKKRIAIVHDQPGAARAKLKDVLSDDPHAPAYQRKRDRVWVQRAKSLMERL